MKNMKILIVFNFNGKELKWSSFVWLALCKHVELGDDWMFLNMDLMG